MIPSQNVSKTTSTYLHGDHVPVSRVISGVGCLRGAKASIPSSQFLTVLDFFVQDELSIQNVFLYVIQHSSFVQCDSLL